MAIRCTVCTHASLKDIDRDLITGYPFRSLAQKYGLSASALHRHTKHLARALENKRRLDREADMRGFLDKLDLVEHRLNRIFHDSTSAHSLRVALECLKEYVRLLTLQNQVRVRLED